MKYKKLLKNFLKTKKTERIQLIYRHIVRIRTLNFFKYYLLFSHSSENKFKTLNFNSKNNFQFSPFFSTPFNGKFFISREIVVRNEMNMIQIHIHNSTTPTATTYRNFPQTLRVVCFNVEVVVGMPLRNKESERWNFVCVWIILVNWQIFFKLVLWSEFWSFKLEFNRENKINRK